MVPRPILEAIQAADDANLPQEGRILEVGGPYAYEFLDMLSSWFPNGWMMDKLSFQRMYVRFLPAPVCRVVATR